MSGKCNQSI